MRTPVRTIRRTVGMLARNDRGSAAILCAVLIVVLMWCSAFAVDLGSLYFERRTAQGAVDLAAIAAARDIASGEAAARATLAANEIRYISGLSVTPGHYRADPNVPPERRFTAEAEPYNAVHVQLRQNAPLYLAGALIGVKTMSMQTEAVATTTEQAAFSIGSRLLRLEGGIANAMLEALLGGSLKLTVMDYNALADANVKLFRFMDALASELKLTGASYNEVLAADSTAGNVVDAMAKATAASGQTEASQALRAIGSSTNAWRASVPLGTMVDLGPYGDLSTGSPAPGFDPSVNVMQMVSAAAALANGDSQFSFNLGATVPGLANVRVDVAIGEREQHSPWLTVGERGAIVRTAQTRVRIDATVGDPDKHAPLSVRVPLYAEIAYAEGRLDEIVCGGDPERDAEVTVAAQPGVAELWLGEVDTRRMSNFSRRPKVGKAALVHTPLARVTGKAHAAITNMSETLLTFDQDDIREQRAKSTSTRDPVTTLLDSLIRDLDLEVKVAGLGLGLPGALQKTVANILSAATPALDRVLGGVLEAVGVTIGEADITVRGVRCDGAALVG